MENSYIYIMTNEHHNVVYVGVTSDLPKRIYEHKNGITGGFSSRYNVTKLVYYEVFENIEEAIKREKRLKKHKREQKDKLIAQKNPEWRDLYEGITL